MEEVIRVLEGSEKGMTSREMRLKGINVERKQLRLLERKNRVVKTMQGGSPAEYCYTLAEVGETNS